jgi:ATP-dependent RNA helicase DDX24/MAK5
MPPTTKTKRPLNSISRQPSRKRAKLGPGTKVSLDDLDWKEVSMPDRLDDVEGFYGLEEVDGVDVITHENGRVEYSVRRLFPVSDAMTDIR